MAIACSFAKAKVASAAPRRIIETAMRHRQDAINEKIPALLEGFRTGLSAQGTSCQSRLGDKSSRREES